MRRHLICLMLMCVVNDLVFAQTKVAIQNWECAIDLHQGDTGVLSLQRSGDQLTGMITVTRNESIFETKVNGQWLNNEITIKRLLGANSSDTMSGVVIAIGTEEVKMGGRFSDTYQGVWSADCNLASASPGNPEQSQRAAGDDIEPSTSTRVSPNSPTANDSITFSARATHPDGIKSISFFLGKKNIHTCQAEVCDFELKPLSKGTYNWRVEALSESGVKSAERFDEFVVRASAGTGGCTIAGIATGPAAELSSLYLVRLFGPNDVGLLKDSAEFNNGAYTFAGLGKGRYFLTVDTQADKGLLVTPVSGTVNCQAAGDLLFDFDFR